MKYNIILYIIIIFFCGCLLGAQDFDSDIQIAELNRVESQIGKSGTGALDFIIVNVVDSKITFKIKNGISQGRAELIYGADLTSLRNSPHIIFLIDGPIEANHQFDIEWPHPEIVTGNHAAFFQFNHLTEKEPVPGSDYRNEFIGAKLIWVEPGTFLMGSPESEAGRDSDETLHSATLTKGYWLGQTEVTQAQWAAVMGTNPSYFSGRDQLPVESISWEACQEFCKSLTGIERRAGRLPESMTYSLPTETQWEYACRAGSAGMTWLGDFDFTSNDSFAIPGNGETGLKPGGKARQSQVVGIKQANPWGFHDMHGNVWEWCSDWYYPEYLGQSRLNLDPKGPRNGEFRVLRGGSWVNFGRSWRSANRGRMKPKLRYIDIGFRLSIQTE